MLRVLLTAIALSVASLGRVAAVCAEPAWEAGPASEPALEEVEVLGERPGPQMWKVSKGDHTLWLFGTLQPLPKKMKWRSRPVEAVLDEAQEVLAGGVSVEADIGPITAFRLYRQWRRMQRDPDGAPLKETVPAPLYARFSALKAKYAPRDKRIETLRPLFAGGRLFGKAIEASDLSSGRYVQNAVLKMAKRRKVKVRKIQIEIDDPKGLLDVVAEIPRETQLVCLESTLARMETDVGAIKARAEAWAVGDVDALRELPYVDQEAACWAAVGNAPRIKELIDRAQTAWFDAAEEALEKNSTTLALQSIDRLLGPQGLLERFKAKGYTVEGP